MNQLGLAIMLMVLVGSRTLPAGAHDFWLQPTQYWVSPRTSTSLTLQVGHGPFRQRSPIPARRILRFEALAPDGTGIDLHGQLRLGMATEDGNFQLEQPGTYILVLQTDNHAQTHLPSIRFNDYLRV